MGSEDIFDARITRRDFMKGVGAVVGGATALGGAVLDLTGCTPTLKETREDIGERV
jgi:hypothetical protein